MGRGSNTSISGLIRSGKTHEFVTTKAAGKFAVGYEISYKELVYRGKGVVEFVWPDKEWVRYDDYEKKYVPTNFRPGKMNTARIRMKHGVEYAGYKTNVKPRFIGKAKQILQKAKVVRGTDFRFKDLVKELGFKWNREKKQWEKP